MVEFALALACAVAPPPGPIAAERRRVDELRRVVREGKPAECLGAIASLTEMRGRAREAVPDLLDVLERGKGWSEAKRPARVAIILIGLEPAAELGARLEAIQKKGPQAMKRDRRHILHQLSLHRRRARPALGPLLHELNHPDPGLANLAALSIVRLGPDVAAWVILAGAKSPWRNEPTFRHPAVLALMGPPVLPRLRRALYSAQVGEAYVAALALSAMKASAAGAVDDLRQVEQMHADSVIAPTVRRARQDVAYATLLARAGGLIGACPAGALAAIFVAPTLPQQVPEVPGTPLERSTAPTNRWAFLRWWRLIKIVVLIGVVLVAIIRWLKRRLISPNNPTDTGQPPDTTPRADS